MRGIGIAALAALAMLVAAVSAEAADSTPPKTAAAKPAATASAKKPGHYYVMKCKTDACKQKHPSGRYYVPIKPKKGT